MRPLIEERSIICFGVTGSLLPESAVEAMRFPPLRGDLSSAGLKSLRKQEAGADGCSPPYAAGKCPFLKTSFVIPLSTLPIEI